MKTEKTNRSIFLEIVESKIKVYFEELSLEKQTYANNLEKIKDSIEFWTNQINQFQNIKSAYLQAKHKATEADGQLNYKIMEIELNNLKESSDVSVEINCLTNGEWHLN